MTIHVFPGTVPELGIQLDSPEWFEWLSQQLQFKYCGNCTEMSVKRRASNGKWYARKKVYSSDKGSVPIDLYVGTDSDCTAEKLIELNYYFGLEWQKFWQWYHSPARRGEKGKGVQQEMSTLATNSSQIGEEIAQLRAKLREVEKENAKLKQELEVAESLAQKNFQERNEMWEKFRGAHAKNQQLQEELNSRCQQPASKSLESESNSPDPDASSILQRLRKEYKKSKADMKDVELIIELLQAQVL
jgi:hypothetical protein